MSEPLTTHEIEDVLSSIRRLVSEDLRPVARSAAAAAPAAADAGKLLLTPALRIVPEAAPPAPVADITDTVEPDAAPVPAPPTAAPWPPILLSDDDYEDEGLNSAQSGDAMVVPETVPEIVTDEVSLQPAAPDAGDDLIWSAPGDTDAPMTEDLDMVESPEAIPDSIPDSIGDTLPEAPGHWTAQEVPGVGWVQEETDWVEPEPMAFVAHPRKSGLASDPLARAWADRAEAEVRQQLGGLGPRPTVKPPESAAPKPASAPKPAASPEPAAAPQATAGQSDGLFDGDDAEIDEEALREIVRDIIREELAGALGERITRNVRKLVRVEINRALTAREFE